MTEVSLVGKLIWVMARNDVAPASDKARIAEIENRNKKMSHS